METRSHKTPTIGKCSPMDMCRDATTSNNAIATPSKSRVKLPLGCYTLQQTQVTRLVNVEDKRVQFGKKVIELINLRKLVFDIEKRRRTMVHDCVKNRKDRRNG